MSNIDVIINDSVGWDINRNIDVNIDRYIDSGVDSGVSVEVERKGEKGIKLEVEGEVYF